MFDLVAELRALVAAFDARSVPYALCGGLAMAVHGVTRATKDIDLLVRREDLERARECARSAGFDVEAAPMRVGSGVEIHRLRKIAGKADVLVLDLLIVTDVVESAWTSRLVASLMDGTLSVVSRDGLIALKRLAGRPLDLRDIEMLESAE